MSAIEQLLKVSTLVRPDKTTVPTASLDGKYVILYFSAHWCGPCRGFTPEFAKWYNATKATRSDFEVVFVSSDRDAASFQEYHASMPWLAVGFDAAAQRAAISTKIGVRGIPMAVVIDTDGRSIITKDARSGVMGDPTGFPWKPLTFAQMTAGPLVTKAGVAGQPATWAELAEKHEFVALYFSAHWCGPCRGFTPALAEWYLKATSRGDATGRSAPQVIFVSRDKSADQFAEYHGEMPWPALPFGDARIAQLAKHYELSGIPTLMVIRTADGTVVNEDAVGRVGADDSATEWPFEPKPFPDFVEFGPSEQVVNALQNGEVCVILETQTVTSAADEAAVLERFKTAAATINAKYGDASGAESKVRCMYTTAKPPGKLSEAENAKCPAGHDLVNMTRPSRRCDVCGNGVSGAGWHCVDCDFDKCQSCHSSRASPLPPALGILSQVERVGSIPARSAAGPSLVVIQGRVGQRLSGSNLDTVADIVDGVETVLATLA